MFKVIGTLFKAAAFTVLVLIAAHYITWDGKTVSDQVRSTLSSAEKSAPVKTVRSRSRALVEDAKEAASRVGVDRANEPIPAEDRERLQALIHSSEE